MAIVEFKPALRATRTINDPFVVSAAESAANRPGDARSLFAGALTGAAKDLAPLTIGTVVTNDDGAALRIPSTGEPIIVAHRQDFAIEPGQVYVGRGAVRRTKNTSDPLGDAVEFKLAWLDRNKGLISTIVVDSRSLVAGDGRHVISCTFSRDMEADYTAPAGARYVRPYWRLLGGNGITDVEVLDRWVTSGLPGPQGNTGDVTPAAQAARADAVQAAIDAAESAEAAADAVNVRLAPSRGAAISLDIPEAIGAIQTQGYYAPGDGGGALYRRAESDPVHAGKFQSADGAWWELAETLPNVRQFGARLNGDLANPEAGDDDWQAFQDALRYAPNVFVPKGTANISQDLIVPIGHRLQGVGPKVRMFGGVYSDDGTCLKTFGMGVAKLWTDIDGNDTPKKAFLVAGGSGCSFADMSIANVGATAWDFGIHVPGVKRTRISNVNTFGLWSEGGVYLDATWGTGNVTLNSVHPDIVPDDGPIETVIDRCWLRGKWGLTVQGTTRNPADYPGNAFVWSPAGISELAAWGTRLDADTDFIPVSERAVDGGGLRISARTPSGTTGNRGWRAVFSQCAFRSQARYQILLDYAHRIAFSDCDGETPGTAGLDGPAVLGLTSNVGDIAFVDNNADMRVRYNGVEIATAVYGVPGVLPNGSRFTYVGRDGRLVTPNLNLQTAANIPEFYSGQSDGVFDFIRRVAGAVTSVARLSALSWRAGEDNVTELGTTSIRFKGVKAERFHPGTAIDSRFWTSGPGSPEGVVTAAVGSLYTRTNGGAGTTLYVKESGTGATGWVAK